MTNRLTFGQNTNQIQCQDYVRSDVRPGVMHLGVGAFHRAHQAVYFDRLLALPEGKKWGITGVNLRPQDSAQFARFIEQDGEYILKTMAADGAIVYQHIRSLVKQIDGAKTPDQVDQQMADSATQLVTSTVTEGGYYLDETRQLMLDHPAIKGDLAGQRHTLYAFLYAGLKLRSQTSQAKITLLCCDNLRHNGDVLKAGLMQFLNAKGDQELAQWVNENVAFPCSMVDRITPKPSPEHVQDVQQRFATDDELTVMGEDFIQWVVEDNFAGAKPPLEQVGVQFVDQVDPYEEAKIRILNAGHTNVVYQAALKGMTYFDEAMRDEVLRQYFRDFVHQDAIPAIGNSIVNLEAYADIIERRFSNANIGDTVERICTDGYAKFPIFVYPSLTGCYQLGQTPSKTIEGIAAWFVYFQKARTGSISTPYHEPNLESLQPYSDDEEGIQAFANNRFLWGDIPRQHPQFIAQLSQAVRSMQQKYSM